MVLEAPITFQAGDTTVHSPMVQVRVGDVETKLILDTGALAHVLTIDLAGRAGLPVQEAPPGTDFTGSPVPSWNIGELAIDVAGSTLVLHDAVAIEGPPPFAGWGIGGFLSPQLLHPSALAVLDLAAGTLLLVDGETPAVLAWLDVRYPAHRGIDATREPSHTLTVRAAIEPFDDRLAVLDTGSFGTEFEPGAVPGLGQGVAAAPSGFGVGGNPIETVRVTDQVLRVGGTTFPLPVLELRDLPTPEGFEGMERPEASIGTDVLGGTVLAIGRPGAGVVRWLVP